MGGWKVKGREEPLCFSSSLVSWDGSPSSGYILSVTLASIRQDHRSSSLDKVAPALGLWQLLVSHYPLGLGVTAAPCCC